MGSFIKHWDDDVMLSLCKLVEFEEGHLKSGDNMTLDFHAALELRDKREEARAASMDERFEKLLELLSRKKD